MRIPAERPVDLVSLRTSQINGCAFCVDMHWKKNAGAAGANEERLYSLDAWRESLLYSDRERAGLDQCPAMTFVAETHVLDAVWERAPRRLRRLCARAVRLRDHRDQRAERAG